MLNVAIAVDSPTDYGPQALQIIVAACEEVIGEQRCPAASELAPGMVTAWFAVVHPGDPALGSVRIEFRDRTANGTLIDERSMTFAKAASQQSRLTSIGSVIAALAAAREGGPIPPRARPASPKPTETTPPAHAEPHAATDDAAPDVTLNIAGVAAPSIARGPYRLGALAGLHIGLGSRAFALASARYWVHPENPNFSWFSLSTGIGSRLFERSEKLNLELTGELVVERTSVTVTRDAQEEGDSRVGFGPRVGANAVWMVWPSVGFVLGLDATWILPRIRIDVAGQDVARVPLVTFAVSGGMRFQL
jgi:hypothetical protein